MRVHVLQGVVVLLAGVLVAGCTSASKPPLPEPTLGAIPTITSPDQVSLPLDAYLPSADQTVAMMMMYQSLVNQCLAAQGSADRFSYFVDASDADGNIVVNSDATTPATTAQLTTLAASDVRNRVTRDAMWAFFDPSTASEYGYLPAPSDAASLHTSAAGDPTSPTSCTARVDAVTPGGNAFMIAGGSMLPDGGSPWRSDDSRFVAAEKQWSDCMQQQGFSFTTPQDAIGQAMSRDPNAPNAAAQKAQDLATAQADVQCKISTNLVGVGAAVQTAYDQRYIDSHRDQLAAFQQQIADYLAGKVTVPATVAVAPGTPAQS